MDANSSMHGQASGLAPVPHSRLIAHGSPRAPQLPYPLHLCSRRSHHSDRLVLRTAGSAGTAPGLPYPKLEADPVLEGKAESSLPAYTGDRRSAYHKLDGPDSVAPL